MMSITITANRFKTIHKSINSQKTLTEKIENATKEGIGVKLKAFFSSSYRENINQKHKEIEKVITCAHNITTAISSSAMSDSDRNNEIIYNLDVINRNDLNTKFKLITHENKNEITLQCEKDREQIEFSQQCEPTVKQSLVDNGLISVNQSGFFSATHKNQETSNPLIHYNLFKKFKDEEMNKKVQSSIKFSDIDQSEKDAGRIGFDGKRDVTTLNEVENKLATEYKCKKKQVDTILKIHNQNAIPSRGDFITFGEIGLLKHNIAQGNNAIQNSINRLDTGTIKLSYTLNMDFQYVNVEDGGLKEDMQGRFKLGEAQYTTTFFVNTEGKIISTTFGLNININKSKINELEQYSTEYKKEDTEFTKALVKARFEYTQQKITEQIKHETINNINIKNIKYKNIEYISTSNMPKELKKGHLSTISEESDDGQFSPEVQHYVN